MTPEQRLELALRAIALGYLVLLLAAPVGLVFYRTFEHGFGPAWDAVTTPEALHALLAHDPDGRWSRCRSTPSSAWSPRSRWCATGSAAGRC